MFSFFRKNQFQKRNKKTIAKEPAEVKLHPRRLARSIAKSMGEIHDWRHAVAQLPRTGQKYLRPERHRDVARAPASSAVIKTGRK